jgi:hypothetical protein
MIDSPIKLAHLKDGCKILRATQLINRLSLKDAHVYTKKRGRQKSGLPLISDYMRHK